MGISNNCKALGTQVLLESIIKVSYFLVYQKNNMTISIGDPNDDVRKELIAAHKEVSYGVFQPTPFHVLDDIVNITSLKPGMRIFDFGCGDGLVSRLLAHRNYHVDGVEEDYEVWNWGTLVPSHYSEAFEMVLSEYDSTSNLDEVLHLLQEIENRVNLNHSDAFTARIDFSVYDVVYLYYPEPVGQKAKEEFDYKLDSLLSNSKTGIQADGKLLVLRQGSKKPINLPNFVLESTPMEMLTHSAKAHHLADDELRKRGVVDSMTLSIYKVIK